MIDIIIIIIIIVIIIIVIIIIIIDKNHTVFKLSQLTSETSFVLLKIRRKKIRYEKNANKYQYSHKL